MVIGHRFFDCGKCQSCQSRRRRDWNIRLTAELEHWSSASFLTLTYNDDNLPANGSLLKSDLQKFFKRLRHHLGRERKIKYYACGEYGGTTGRPHYHAIIFGLHASERDLIHKSWTLGFNDLKVCTPESIGYVTKYIQKQSYLRGRDGKYFYLGKQLTPPFRISSQSLGIEYLLKNYDELKRTLSVPFKGKACPLPRAWRKFMMLTEQHFTKWLEEKKRFMVQFYRQAWPQLSIAEKKHLVKYGLSIMPTLPTVYSLYKKYLKNLEADSILRRYTYYM